MTSFTNVRLTPWYNPNSKKTGDEKKRPVMTCDLDKYRETIASIQNACELVSVGEKCKVYLDWDDKVDASECYGAPDFIKKPSSSVTMSLNQRITEHLRKAPLLCDQPYTVLSRHPRMDKGKVKYSYRIIFNNLVTDDFTKIKDYLMSVGFENDNPFDLGVYNAGDLNGQMINSVYSTKPDCQLEMTPLWQETDIKKMLITVVNDNLPLVEWDKCVVVAKQKPVKIKSTVVLGEDDGDDTSILSIISKLHSERSDAYETWTRMVWCIMNICNDKGIGLMKCSKLVHLFSKKSKKYSEDDVDKFIDANMYKTVRNPLGWKYLYECLKEDDPLYYDKVNIPTYRTYKGEFEKKHCKILYPPMVLVSDKDNEYCEYSMKQVKDMYEHVQVKEKKEKKEGSVWEKAEFIKLWMKDKDIRRYDKVVFKPPPLLTKEYEYNTWVDFKIATEPSVAIERDYFAEYCGYLKNLINDEAVENYILARYASRFQRPAYRTNVCLIICGSEGDGKNMLLAPIYLILGKYGIALDDANKLYEKHATYEKEKLFVLINEAGGDANFNNCEILKSRITDTELWVNPKGLAPFSIENRADYDMTTNNINVVKLTDDSHRRFLQVETTSYYKGNTEFFNEYSKSIVDNPLALKQIYDGLMKFNVEKIIPSGNFQAHKPVTEISLQVKERNRDKILYFLEDVVRNNASKGVFQVHNRDFFDEWNMWLSRNKVKNECNNIQFGQKLTTIIKKHLNVGGVVCIKRDVNNGKNTLYITELKAYFAKLNGYEITSDCEDEN